MTRFLPDPSHVCRFLNLAAIEQSLRQVQAEFSELNARLDERRDPLADEVIANMIEGYRLVDQLVYEKVDLFDLQHLDLMVEINNTVLCGRSESRRAEYSGHIQATIRRFYETEEGGAKDILEWYQLHHNESVWKRVAGVFVRILSKPQLFIEGNHRSGTLIASYVLMREQKPPFVLTLENAVGFFNPSSVVRRMPKKGISALFKLPKIKKRYAEFLQQQSHDRFLLNGKCHDQS